MKKYLYKVIFVCLLFFVSLAPVSLAASQPAQLNDFEKATVESIREITLQLILIAMGVFALLGGFATAENHTFRKRPLIWIAFILLGVSVVFGLLAYGNLIWTLGKELFEPFGSLRILAAVQWITFGLGGMFFLFFVLLNIRRGP